MTWTDKYWDIIGNLYWTPRYLGLKSIPRNKWRSEESWVMIPKALILNSSGPLYTRARKFDELKAYLQSQEEILNHVFNLTFAIAEDAAVVRLLFGPLGIDDGGPIERLGREVGARYGWSGENITQQDGLFISARSIVGVELKLGSQSWPEQIAKYLALMMWEEAIGGPREQLGLLFIVLEESVSSHWRAIGLKGPVIDDGFLGRLDRAKLPRRIQQLFDSEPARAKELLSRLRMAVVSWADLSREIKLLDQESNQTLQRLLSGFQLQIDAFRSSTVETSHIDSTNDEALG